MSAHTSDRADPDTRADGGVTSRWVILQRSVAGGMIAAFAFIMVFVARSFVPPLAVFGVVFAVPLALTAWRRRGPAIAIGTLSVIWLLFQVVNASQVLPDLADPTATASFIATAALVTFPIAGAVGLVGMVRRTPESAATRTLRVAGAVIVLVAATGLVAGALAGGEPVTVSEGPATVILRDIEFQPANLQVTAGTTVTWEWADRDIEHDVVAGSFASDLKAQGTFANTFDAPGTYAYRCSVHPAMTGTVTVVAGGTVDDNGDD